MGKRIYGQYYNEFDLRKKDDNLIKDRENHNK